MENKTIWKIDPAHSEIMFKVKHLMITNVKGEFRKFDASISTSNNNFSDAEIEAEIEASSIFTNNDARDNHLRSADFFNTENNKNITFKSTGVQRSDDDFTVTGDLTMNGITKSVTLNVDFGGIIKDPYGNEKAGFSATGKLNRKDWNISWNAALESGGLMVSDEVKITIEAQFIKQV